MTGLTIANPLFLWMLPLVALPVVFHLFLKVRKRSHPFPSLMFFRRADPRLSARRRLREWLALLLRMAAILFLLLAFARIALRGTGTGGAVAQALVIDNSASMQAPADADTPKLSLALQAAAAVIDEMSPDDRCAIVLTVDDPLAALPPDMTADAVALRAALDRVRPTEAEGRPGHALRRALALLEHAPQPRREVHIFSDLQENEWMRGGDDAYATRNVHVTAHRLPSRPLAAANVSVSGLELPAGRLLSGRQAFVSVTLQNHSPSAARVRLNTEDQTGQTSMRTVDVDAGQRLQTRVPLLPPAPGFHWLRVWIEGDGFEADNTAYAALWSRDRERVAFLGDPARFGLLATAVDPTGDGLLSGLLPERVAPETTAWPGDGTPALAVATWNHLNGHSTWLREYAEGGGTLLVVPDPGGGTADAEIPDWLNVAPHPLAERDEGWPIMIFDRDADLWQAIRGDDGTLLLGSCRAFRMHPLSLSGNGRALLGVEDGRVLLAEQRLREGRVFLSGTAFVPDWSNLPLRAGFPAIAHTLAMLAPADAETVHALQAGARLPLPAADRPVQIRSLAGSPLEWRGPGDEMPVIPRSGVLSLESGATRASLAVSACSREAIFRFLSDAPVPALGALQHRVEPFTGIPALTGRLRARRTGADLFVPLVMAALLALLTEGWIVNPRPRPAPRAGRQA